MGALRGMRNPSFSRDSNNPSRHSISRPAVFLDRPQTQLLTELLPLRESEFAMGFLVHIHVLIRAGHQLSKRGRSMRIEPRHSDTE
jgi:hypothetical protein